MISDKYSKKLLRKTSMWQHYSDNESFEDNLDLQVDAFSTSVLDSLEKSVNEYPEDNLDLQVDDSSDICAPAATLNTKIQKKDSDMSDASDRESVNKREKIAIDLANQLCQKFIFGKDSTNLYIYIEELGYFKKLNLTGSDLSLTKLVINNLPGCEALALNKYIINAVNKYLIHKSNKAYVLDSENPRYINLKNGVIDLHTLNLQEHSHEYLFTSYIDACYTQEPMNEESLHFFKHLTRDDIGFKSLMQLAGIAISNKRDYQVAALLVGPPGCGKSVFLNFLHNVMYENSVKSATLDNFSKNTELSIINDAKIIIFPDIESGVISKKVTANLKQVISCDIVNTRKLYNDSIDYRPKAFIIVACNSVPSVDDDPSALERRFVGIYTGDTIPPDRQDEGITKKLINDRDAIISSFINALHTIIIFPQQLIRNKVSFSKSSPDLNEVIKIWFSENFSPDSDSFITSQELFNDFLQAYPNYSHMKLNGFIQRLKNLFSQITTTNEKVGNQRIIRGFKKISKEQFL